MIEVTELSKRFGDTLAVDRLSFAVRPGLVTGFLGPNGAGKSTTLRMILGIDQPTGGSVTVNGRTYTDLPAPMQEVGSLLDAKAIQGGRTAYQHLKWVAQAGRIPSRRIEEVLDLVGLSEVAGRKVGGFSLGMSQRLGIATALLGDPPVLLLDEPVNGLDPEGIFWIRTLMQRLAAEGRTILVSSHLMNEMQETADHVLVIGRGHLIADTSIEDFMHRSGASHVQVISPDAAEFALHLEAAGGAVKAIGEGVLTVGALDARDIGDLAYARGIRLHELSPQRASLETAFMELTQGSVQYQAETPDPSTPADREAAFALSEKEAS